jgi:hypothetical protein
MNKYKGKKQPWTERKTAMVKAAVEAERKRIVKEILDIIIDSQELTPYKFIAKYGNSGLRNSKEQAQEIIDLLDIQFERDGYLYFQGKIKKVDYEALLKAGGGKMKVVNGLKPYMGYSRGGGSQEGAVLIFAHSVKEAKKIGYSVLSGMYVEEYIDVAVNLCKDGDHLFDKNYQWSKDKIAKGEAHVVDSPISCKVCNLWGEKLNDNGLCEDCQMQEDDYKRNAGLVEVQK